jgi:hypothetical protein
MKGMIFVEIVEGRMISQGQIEDPVGPGHYLCHFAAINGLPAEELDAWMKSVQTPSQQAETEKAKTPARKPRKKPAADITDHMGKGK